MKKRSMFCAVLLLFAFLAAPTSSAVGAPAPSFSDVTETNWAYEYIEAMSGLDILSGYTDGTFRPDQIMRRDEFAKVLACMLEIQGIEPADAEAVPAPTDIDSNWAKDYILAVQSYIPYDGASFRPEEVITREDMVTAIIRAMGVDVSTADLSRAQNTFSDYADITEALKPYVAYSLEHEIVTGYPDGSFRPGEGVSRAAACAVLYRSFMQYPYGMMTLLDGMGGLRSMVLTNDNQMVLTDGIGVYFLNPEDSSAEGIELGGTWENACLAYDSAHDIIYLALGDPLELYDVSDPYNPELVYSISEHEDDLRRTGGRISDTRCLYVLSDGSILIPFEENGTWRLDPNTGALRTTSRAYEPTSGYYYGILGDTLYTFRQGDSAATARDLLTGQESILTLSQGAPVNNAQSIAAGPDGFYFWDSSTGLMKIDRAGNFHVVAGLDEIENMDGSSFPYNIWNACVNNQGVFAFYDNSSKCIGVIYEQNGG